MTTSKPQHLKYLKLRGKIWWIQYRLPKILRDHPLYTNAGSIFSQSLKTTNETEAVKRRDILIKNLHEAIGVSNEHDAWVKYYEDNTAKFLKRNKDWTADEYRSLEIDNITQAAANQYGTDDQGHPNELTALQSAQLSGILKTTPQSQLMLKHLCSVVIEDKKLRGVSKSTLQNTSKGTRWFLTQVDRDDMLLSDVTFNMVHKIINNELQANTRASTLRGYLVGLQAIWEHGARSDIVTGQSPFQQHKIKDDTKSFDPLTQEEICKLYKAATVVGAGSSQLHLLIHAAATSGARISELITATVHTPEGYDKPCWLFGIAEGSTAKNSNSRRVVPLHPTLQLSEGFAFELPSRPTLYRQIRRLFEAVIPLDERKDTLNGGTRKLSFHSFRSTVITELSVHHDIATPVIGGLTGHLTDKSIGAINSYIHADSLQRKYELVCMLKWTCGDTTAL